MQISKKFIPFLIPLLPVFLLSGCPLAQRPNEAVIRHNPAEERQNSSAAKRFQQSAPQHPTAVESAIELSKKYAKLSDDASVLRQKNRDFAADNHRLKEQLATCQAELQQTQKELTEANNLLIEMRIELNNWKVDILGFRNEMRDAEKTQLEALLKILKTLGGEVKTKSTHREEASATTGVPISGEPND